jgi:arsenite methyltransferase
MAEKPDYGIDAPGVIRNLLLAGAGCLAVALILPRVTIAHVTLLFFPGFLYVAALLSLSGGLMLLYSKVGKFRHRDRILANVVWTGAESVLDVGAGRGLLLIGAAKRLTTGHATGIDIWNAEDLSNNGPEGLLKNIELEGVSGKTTVRSEDARTMSFPDASFDVVLSNLCLHNIYERPGRARACREIARVLKRGGAAIISDYKHVREYADELRRSGLQVRVGAADWIRTYPPLRILMARKAE